MTKGSTEELVDSLLVELRRGTLVLTVLSQLEHPEYGYSLVQKLEEKDAAIDGSGCYLFRWMGGERIECGHDDAEEESSHDEKKTAEV